jgi:hypothetical protein
VTDQVESEQERITSNLNEPVQADEPVQTNEMDHPLEVVTNEVGGEENRFKPDMEAANEISPALPDTALGRERNGEPEPARNARRGEHQERDGEGISGQGLGWTGLVLSILAFFIFPILFGIAGVAFGFFGYRQGAQTLGIWAMVLGGLAVLGSILFSPYFVR